MVLCQQRIVDAFVLFLYFVFKYLGKEHLFAIAADKSNEWGYEGAMHGFAAKEEVDRFTENLS